MSWPEKSSVVNATDWSYFQQINQHTPPRIIPIESFCAANPTLEVFILRACWPSGLPDPLYPLYYDALTAAGKKVAAYLWPNVTKKIGVTEENWKAALGDRVPKLLMLDFEEPRYGATKDQLTDNADDSLEALAALYPGRHVIGYCRANWWEAFINRKIEAHWKWILAQYPLPFPDGEGGFRQYRTHAELAKHLPIGNSFTPYMGKTGRFTHANVIGWQFSEYGYLPGWTRRLDLDSLKRDFVLQVFGEVAPTPPVPPFPPTLEQRVDDHEKRIAALEAE
jgi:hypothetical protein